MLGCLDGFGGLCVVLGEALWWVGSGTDTFAVSIADTLAHCCAHGIAYSGSDLEADG